MKVANQIVWGMVATAIGEPFFNRSYCMICDEYLYDDDGYGRKARRDRIFCYRAACQRAGQRILNHARICILLAVRELMAERRTAYDELAPERARVAKAIDEHDESSAYRDVWDAYLEAQP